MPVNFQLEWIEKEEYRSWLKPDPSYRNKAVCKLCMKTFIISTMGEPALKSHASSTKHQTALRMSHGMKSVSDYFKGKYSIAKEQKKNFTVFREPIKHKKICPKKGTKQSRNIVALTSMMSHSSYSSSKDIADIFRVMFPDIELHII